jgi:hypothetical protein
MPTTRFVDQRFVPVDHADTPRPAGRPPPDPAVRRTGLPVDGAGRVAGVVPVMRSTS